MQREFKWADPSDYAALGDVMFDAVRNGPSEYSEQQRAAWVPAPREGKEWNARLAQQDIIVAKEAGATLGFMSLADGDYIDFVFTRPVARGTGLFRQMLEHVEGLARTRGTDLLWVHASLNAQPAFAATGFTVRHKEEVAIGSESLERYEMEKTIAK